MAKKEKHWTEYLSYRLIEDALNNPTPEEKARRERDAKEQAAYRMPGAQPAAPAKAPEEQNNPRRTSHDLPDNFSVLD